MLGAIVGVVLYAVIGAVLYPLAETDRPLATGWQARLLARLTVAACAAVAVGLAVDPMPRET